MFIDQDNEFDNNKLTNLDSITVNRDPNLDNELSNKKYVDGQLDKKTIVRFNQTLENYLKVPAGNDTYNPTKYNKYNKTQITDTTNIKYPNTGGYLLQNWFMLCNDINNNGKIQNLIKFTKTTSPTGNSGAGGVPPIGNSFMFNESSGANNNHERIFVSWEKTDILQITNITFCYKRFSINDPNLRSMDRFRIQFF